ncbi:MAG: transposase [Candidatus Jettenia caeni]|nr:transposase [Candidatus Jettenia caeni]
MVKAPLAQEAVGANPTDRGKEWQQEACVGRRAWHPVIDSRNRSKPDIRQRGEEIEEKRTLPGYKPRRWIVEVAHSWFNRFRKLLVRYEKFRET